MNENVMQIKLLAVGRLLDNQTKKYIDGLSYFQNYSYDQYLKDKEVIFSFKFLGVNDD
jgi:hypothetical protein